MSIIAGPLDPWGGRAAATNAATAASAAAAVAATSAAAAVATVAVNEWLFEVHQLAAWLAAVLQEHHTGCMPGGTKAQASG